MRKGETPQYNATFTQVLSNRTVNEIRAGATNYERQDRHRSGGRADRSVSSRAERERPCHPVAGYTIGANTLNIFSTRRPFVTISPRRTTGADATT